MTSIHDKRILALRLAQAASTSWAFCQEEINRIGTAADAAQVYTCALALLLGYVLRANEAIGKDQFTEAQYNEVMEAFRKDVWGIIVDLRTHDEVVPSHEATVPDPTEVH